MEASPQSQAYGSSQWYAALSNVYAPEGAMYPSPAPSDLSPLPRTHQVLEQYAPLTLNDMDYTSQTRPILGPTRSNIRRKTLLGRAAPHASYSDPSPAGLRLDRPKEPYLPTTPSSMASPYEIPRRSRARSASNADEQPRVSSPAPSSTSLSSNGFDATHPPQSGPVRTRAKHRKQRLRDSDRKQICLYHIEHPNARQEDIGAVFGVERSTISKILKSKDKWLNINSEDESNEQSSKHRPSKFPEIEMEMLHSLQIWSDGGTNITDNLIRDRALDIAKQFHISTDRFKGSSGWIENFKHRHDIRRGEWLQAKRRPIRNISNNIPAVSTSLSVATYDQPPATSTSDASSSSQPQTSPPQEPGVPHSEAQVAKHQWSPQEHPHLQPPLALDPALQDASVASNHLHDHHTAIQHSPQQAPYDYNALYSAAVHVPPDGYQGPVDVERPTLAEAEIALNTVIAYISTDGKNILKNDERRLLGQIKFALFQFANGIPYER